MEARSLGGAERAAHVTAASVGPVGRSGNFAVPQQLKPRDGPPAAPSPSPPGRKAGNEVEPPAVFRVAASGSRCWHPWPAPVGDLDPDNVVSRLDRDRDRLAGGTRPAMPQTIGEELAHQLGRHVLAGCPGPSTPSTNARASRARSARPASVTVSRTPQSSAQPPFPARTGTRKCPGRRAGARDARSTRRRASSLDTPPAPLVRGRPWKRRRCVPTATTTHADRRNCARRPS